MWYEKEGFFVHTECLSREIQDSVLSLAQISHEKPHINVLLSSSVATLMVSVVMALVFALTQKGGY